MLLFAWSTWQYDKLSDQLQIYIQNYLQHHHKGKIDDDDELIMKFNFNKMEFFLR